MKKQHPIPNFNKKFFNKEDMDGTRKGFNCARVYVGHYIGGGTNQFEQTIECGYRVNDGQITIKRIGPIQVKGSNSEGTMFTLQTFVLYPKTERAEVAIFNRNHNKVSSTITLIKHQDRTPSTIYRMRL
jgi:hypothetical protein